MDNSKRRYFILAPIPLLAFIALEGFRIALDHSFGNLPETLPPQKEKFFGALGFLAGFGQIAAILLIGGMSFILVIVGVRRTFKAAHRKDKVLALLLATLLPTAVFMYLLLLWVRMIAD